MFAVCNAGVLEADRAADVVNGPEVGLDRPGPHTPGDGGVLEGDEMVQERIASRKSSLKRGTALGSRWPPGPR